MPTFDETTKQVALLATEALRHGQVVPLRELTVQIIWNSRTHTATALTPALVDLALRQLDRDQTVSIADDGLVTLNTQEERAESFS